MLANHELLTTRFFVRSFSEQLPRSFQLVPSGLTGVRFYNHCQVSQKKYGMQLLGGGNRQAMSHNNPAAHSAVRQVGSCGWGPSVQGGVPTLVVSWHSTPFMGRLGHWTPSRISSDYVLMVFRGLSGVSVRRALGAPRSSSPEPGRKDGKDERPRHLPSTFLPDTTDADCVC